MDSSNIGTMCTPTLEPMPIPQGLQPQPTKPTEFRCEELGCKRASKSFTRLPDLQRHQRLHTGQRPYSCLAVDCNRTGQNGFTRKDKCIDHMLDGHDDDTPFRCDRCEQESLPRQLMSVHSRLYGRRRLVILFSLNEYRKCPIPRCKFRIFIGKNGSTLDALQDHLRSSDHPRMSRLTFQERLLDRGYDALSGDIVCPICRAATFSRHADFYNHFAEVHLHMPVAETSQLPCCHSSWSRYHGPFSRYGVVSNEVLENRRTILSLWPLFYQHPVWNDLDPYARKFGN